MHAGYAWFAGHARVAGGNYTRENRLWQQVLFSGNAPKISWFHRVRTEQRFFKVYTGSGENRDEWFTFRARYMFQAMGWLLPPRSISPFAIRWSIADEIMLHAGDNVNNTYFEQNRVVIGPVWHFGPEIELATLYQYNVQQQPNTGSINQLHALRVTILHNLNFYKPDKTSTGISMNRKKAGK
jgi:hypothetical protein